MVALDGGDRYGEGVRLRRVARRRQQAGLADARRTLHDDHAPRAGGHLVECAGDRAQLSLSLVEPAAHGR
jgi:hypothetical protein